MIFKFSFLEKLLLSKDVIPHPFTDAASSVGLGYALGCAVKLGITDALSTDPRDVSSIAQSAQVSEMGAMLVLDCLEALGYVRKNGRSYAFTKRGFKNLSQESSDNFRNFILFCDYLYTGYARLDETIRLGAPPGANMLESMTEREWELFSRAMIDISRTNVKEVVSKIPVPNGATHVSDLGGSHGQYSIELCKRHPDLTARVVDLPPVKRYADECITRYDASPQVSFVAGDFMKDPLPRPNDIVLAFNIIHGFDLAQNERLAEKVFEALNPGGLYVVLDQLKGIGGASQFAKATTSYMALNLLHQAGGRTYTHAEVDGFARKAGFSSTSLRKLNAPGFGLVICTK